MTLKWCHNSKTGEIFSYTETDGITNFPRGTLLAYDDYLTTGFSSKKAAENWKKKYGCCDKCRSSRKPDENGKCRFCGNPVIFIEGD